MQDVALDRETDPVSGRAARAAMSGAGGPGCLDHLAGPQPGRVSGYPFRAMLGWAAQRGAAKWVNIWEDPAAAAAARGVTRRFGWRSAADS